MGSTAVVSVCFLLFLFSSVNSQNTNTTTPSTATTASTATTLSANTGIGPCMCDLTEGICDANCCCDTNDCNDLDRVAFSFCADRTAFPEHYSCFPKQLIFLTNSGNKIVPDTNKLFCFEKDNFNARNWYAAPTLLATEAETTAAIRSYIRYQFSSPPATSLSYPWKYKFRDFMLTYYKSNFIGLLGIPSSINGLCADGGLVGFMKDEAVTCNREITSLADVCDKSSFLSAQLHLQDFKVATRPSSFGLIYTVLSNETFSLYANATGFVEIEVSTICLNGTGHNVNCSNSSQLQAPVYDAATSTCNNVVKKIDYIITPADSGVQAVAATVTLGPLTTPDAAKWVPQTFNVKFQKSDTGTGSPKSGNPGYQFGKPLLAAASTNISGVTTVVPIAEGFLLPGAGICSSEAKSRTAAKFRVGQFMSCTKSLAADFSANCSLLQNEILGILRGAGSSVASTIGTFGNSDASKSGDWISILEDGCDGVSNGTLNAYECSTMVVGQNIRIIYANVGALSNPQAKIIGVTRKCITDDLRYECTSANCTATNSAAQTLNIVSTVSFIDASEPTVAVNKNKAVFEYRVARDFFYPLTSSGASLSASALSVFVILFVSLMR